MRTEEGERGGRMRNGGEGRMRKKDDEEVEEGR